jgi:hypothetical protein
MGLDLIHGLPSWTCVQMAVGSNPVLVGIFICWNFMIIIMIMIIIILEKKLLLKYRFVYVKFVEHNLKVSYGRHVLN